MFVLPCGTIFLTDRNLLTDADLTSSDRIGFASGIGFSSFAGRSLPLQRKSCPRETTCSTSILTTHGAPSGDFLKAMRQLAESKRCRELGEYHGHGFDTFGPFKPVGGIAKGHPTEEEIAAAARFYQTL